MGSGNFQGGLQNEVIKLGEDPALGDVLALTHVDFSNQASFGSSKLDAAKRFGQSLNAAR